MKEPSRQWRYWCIEAGLLPCLFEGETLESISDESFYSLRGYDRHWRITCNGEFQVSEPYEHFDRWANSVEETFKMPNSQKDLMKIVDMYKEPPHIKKVRLVVNKKPKTVRRSFR